MTTLTGKAKVLQRSALLAATTLALAGCVDSAALELPPLVSERKVLTKDEQAQALADLRRRADQQSADTLRQIEQRKP
ncbi:MAG: hypothetical protein ACKVP7_00615 [Hyphomicrobiaceae bacterium]